jgi:hypothetical protein
MKGEPTFVDVADKTEIQFWKVPVDTVKLGETVIGSNKQATIDTQAVFYTLDNQSFDSFISEL